VSSPTFQICFFAKHPNNPNGLNPELDSGLELFNLIRQSLPKQRYSITSVTTLMELQAKMTRPEGVQDCLVVWGGVDSLAKELFELSILLPIVIISAPPTDQLAPALDYAVHLAPQKLAQLPQAIDQAIRTFLELSPPSSCELKPNAQSDSGHDRDPQLAFSLEPSSLVSLATQQRRLSKKLKERLGYLGVYYKRNSRQFWRNLSDSEKKQYRDRLVQIYREIVLEYFKESSSAINNKIDEFVNAAFFADFSVSQVLEIHMNLMDEFSQKLKVEGRSEEILLDYRITLIDIIAHLCEMYRRSIPRDT
jgi:circadian clock protein KaiA